MCRFLAYQGTAVYLEDLVASPCHSLIHQSLHATEAKTGTNGDGFGLGWYGHRPEPGIYREIRPAWSDENLKSIACQVRSHLFFAHVRAATGTASTRANCHPFSHGRWMFMHNGQVGGYGAIKRALEAMIPDAYYEHRQGTTDSEAIFLSAMAKIDAGMAPVAALATVLADTQALMMRAHVTEPLRFAAVISDGKTMYAVRWASDAKPPSLYVCQQQDSVIVASEPVDARRDCWTSVACNSAIEVRDGMVTRLPLDLDTARAA